MSKYQNMKNHIREQAIEFQNSFNEGVSWSYAGLGMMYDYFLEMGRRYGLLREFRENGII